MLEGRSGGGWERVCQRAAPPKGISDGVLEGCPTKKPPQLAQRLHYGLGQHLPRPPCPPLGKGAKLGEWAAGMRVLALPLLGSLPRAPQPPPGCPYGFTAQS